jgi:creatinine amidohydrolase
VTQQTTLKEGASMLPHRHWHEMTALDVREGETARWIVILPVAAIEQHGPHLPLHTDTCIAEGLIRRTIELIPDDLPVSFLPVQAIGKSNEHSASPGTITASWDTAIKLWIEIGDSVARAGVRKLIVVTSHGGNVPMIDIVARELRVRQGMLAVATAWARFGHPPDLFEPDETLYGIHGGDIETSIMLHLRPDLVRMDKACDFPSSQREFTREFKHLRAHGPVQLGWMAQDLNPAGAVGNAAAATAGKGKATVDHQAHAFVELCRDVDAFDPARLWRS